MLSDDLRQAGIPVFPCSANKRPAVPKKMSWRDACDMPPSSLNWSSGLVGVPVPPGVAIIDLDLYKGVTRAIAERAIGCALPWDAALIQRTQSGGEHYAFSVAWDMRQGDCLCDTEGLDTRAAGLGFIATGAGYVPHGFGVFRLAHPASLPQLPDACKTALAKPVAPAPHVPAVRRETSDLDIWAAVAAIKPSCSRADWLRIGLALRSHYQDRVDEGFDIFDTWSRGDMLEPPEVPENYDSDGIYAQWVSFKAAGATTVGTLFHMAIESGWCPPAGLDTSEVFGHGAMDSQTYTDLVEQILSEGADPRKTDGLVALLTELTCSELQRNMLRATLQRELKQAGLLNSPIRKALEATTPIRVKQTAEYGKNHTENALAFISTEYPDRTLLRSRAEWYAYSGKAWQHLDDDLMTHQVAMVMAPSAPLFSAVSGTVSMMSALCTDPDRKMGQLPGHLLMFQNGVLDSKTWTLHPHSPEYLSSNLLPYDYDPDAACPAWIDFINVVLEGDQERIDLIQEWLGYMMSGGYEHQKIMFILGPPRSGKGTIGRVMHALVGEVNFSGGSLMKLLNDAFLQSLVDKSALFIGDAAKNLPRGTPEMVTETLKTISGNDCMSINRKWKDNLSLPLPTRITIAANHVPRLFDDSGALASRLLVLTMNVSFLNREDPDLFDKLLPDLKGIATWALFGLARLQQNRRFTTPAASAEEVKYIGESYSPVSLFLEADCLLGGNTSISCQELYQAYMAWELRTQEDMHLTRRMFITSFKDKTRGKPVAYGVQNGVRGFRGVSIRRPNRPPNLTVVN